MSRRLVQPSVNKDSQTLPVANGGTATATPRTSVIAETLIDNSEKDVASGAVSLDAGSKVPLPRVQDYPDTPLIKEELVAYNLIKNTFTISNFDSFKTYSISVSNGTYTQNQGTLTLIPNQGVTSMVLTINGKIFNILVKVSGSKTPVMLSPNIDGTVQILSTSFISDNYVGYGAPSAHQSTDWQLATDSNFTNIVYQSQNDTVNKNSWSVSNLTISTLYYVRVRYKGDNGVYSNWSVPRKFNTYVMVQVEYLLVAGGGAGGSDQYVGGGGGGGEVLQGSIFLPRDQSIPVTIGQGGIATLNQVNDGGDSSLGTYLTARGGKGASRGYGGYSGNGKAGGAPYGNGGWWEGGGGGDNAAAVDINGGAGTQWSIDGNYYGGGGGAGVYNHPWVGETGGVGGIGGGGHGHRDGYGTGTAGQANTGGGGGGGSGVWTQSNQGWNGGSGKTVIRYAGVPTMTGGTITQSGGYTYHTFLGNGVLNTGTADFVFNAVITSATNNYNLKTAAITAGWDQVLPLNATVTLNAGVEIGSNSAALYSFDTGAGFPAGTKLTAVFSGNIIGAGGKGGNGSSGSSAYGTPVAGGSGEIGGPAFRAQYPIAVTLNGTIASGGSGGSGGTGTRGYKVSQISWYGGGGGGGGGGQGSTPGAGGSGGWDGLSSPMDGYFYQAPSGTSGTRNTSGAGGAGGRNSGDGDNPSYYGSAGGNGGALGGGVAVTGNSNVTWSGSGTKIGTVV